MGETLYWGHQGRDNMLLAPSQMSCPLLKLSVIQTVMVASTEMRHPI